MAKVKKRGGSYQIDYLDPHGKRVRLVVRKRKSTPPNSGSEYL